MSCCLEPFWQDEVADGVQRFQTTCHVRAVAPALVGAREVGARVPFQWAGTQRVGGNRLNPGEDFKLPGTGEEEQCCRRLLR